MTLTVGKFLRERLERKKAQNPQYSIRSLARNMDISAGFLSRILADKKSLPLKHFKSLVRLLDMDDADSELLLKLVDPLVGQRGNRTLGETGEKFSRISENYRAIPKNQYWVLNKWYYLAIIDLTTVSGFQSETCWIAKKLKLKKSQVEDAVTLLLDAKILILDGETLKKSEQKIRFPTNKSQTEVRNYHRQMLVKASEQLTDTTEENFESRSIQGITLAGNPENMARARKKLSEALYEAAEIMAEGPVTEIYQLNLQFFPLSKPDP